MNPSDTVEAAAARTGWGTAPLWTIARRVDRTGFPDAELLSVYRDWGVVRKADRDDNFNVESDDLNSYKFVKRGDLVLNKMKTWQGSLGVSDFEGIVSPAYFTCELSPTVHPRFIHYLLRSDVYIAMYAAASKGIRPNQWDLPYEEFKSLEALLPPLEEQRRIADLLDERLNGLDQLVALRCAQIDLVGEILASRIHAAFESLGNVRGRESEGKQAVRGASTLVGLGQLATFRKGIDSQRLTATYVAEHPGPYPVYSGQTARGPFGHIDSFDFDIDEAILISTVGLAGRTKVVQGRLSLSQNCALITPRTKNVDVRFLDYQLRSLMDSKRAEIPDHMQASLRLRDLSSMRIQVPDMSTQRQVVSDLVKFEEAAETLCVTLRSTVSKYSALRSSLITAAVTGELDVTTARREVPV